MRSFWFLPAIMLKSLSRTRIAARLFMLSGKLKVNGTGVTAGSVGAAVGSEGTSVTAGVLSAGLAVMMMVSPEVGSGTETGPEQAEAARESIRANAAADADTERLCKRLREHFRLFLGLCITSGCLSKNTQRHRPRLTEIIT